MPRFLFACGGLAAEAATHLMSFSSSSVDDANHWLCAGLLATLPAAYAILGGIYSVLFGNHVARFDFDPAYVKNHV